MMKKILTLLLFTGTFLLFSCEAGPKDEDVKLAVESALRANPDLNGLGVDVHDGIATITGEVKDETTKASIHGLLKDVKGAKEIVNNTTIAPPPPPPATVTVSADDTLHTPKPAK